MCRIWEILRPKGEKCTSVHPLRQFQTGAGCEFIALPHSWARTPRIFEGWEGLLHKVRTLLQWDPEARGWGFITLNPCVPRYALPKAVLQLTKARKSSKNNTRGGAGLSLLPQHSSNSALRLCCKRPKGLPPSNKKSAILAFSPLSHPESKT